MNPDDRDVTVALIPKAQTALDTAMTLSGTSATDTMNHAIQVYAWLCEEVVVQRSKVLVRGQDGHQDVVSFTFGRVS